MEYNIEHIDGRGQSVHSRFVNCERSYIDEGVVTFVGGGEILCIPLARIVSISGYGVSK